MIGTVVLVQIWSVFRSELDYVVDQLEDQSLIEIEYNQERFESILKVAI